MRLKPGWHCLARSRWLSEYLPAAGSLCAPSLRAHPLPPRSCCARLPPRTPLQKPHSRARVRERDIALAKGRHSGTGKRRGTANARMPGKVVWIRRTRVLRRMLARYRKAKKIDKHLYHELYLQCKGARYKTKKALMEVRAARAEGRRRCAPLSPSAGLLAHLPPSLCHFFAHPPAGDPQEEGGEPAQQDGCGPGCVALACRAGSPSLAPSKRRRRLPRLPLPSPRSQPPRPSRRPMRGRRRRRRP